MNENNFFNKYFGPYIEFESSTDKDPNYINEAFFGPYDASDDFIKTSEHQTENDSLSPKEIFEKKIAFNRLIFKEILYQKILYESLIEKTYIPKNLDNKEGLLDKNK